MSAPAAASPSFRKILLVRTDRVGDLVLTTPAIASFRRSWPDARIRLIVNEYT
jgi:ADP-heptose:LPS heptosyltransferase